MRADDIAPACFAEPRPKMAIASFIAACGSGRSTSFIPAVPAAWSVTTIAFIVHLLAGSMSLSSEFQQAEPACRFRVPDGYAGPKYTEAHSIHVTPKTRISDDCSHPSQPKVHVQQVPM